MIELNEKSDIFLVGSDQIWHHDLYKPFGEVCYFDYVYNSKKKIAYAASLDENTGTVRKKMFKRQQEIYKNLILFLLEKKWSGGFAKKNLMLRLSGY